MTGERIGAREVAAIVGEPIRTVQLMAARGKIPSAAQLLTSRWTFNEETVRAWIKEREEQHLSAVAAAKAASRRINERSIRVRPPVSGGKRSKELDKIERSVSTNEAYEWMKQKLLHATSPPEHFDKDGRWMPVKERRRRAKHGD